MIVFVSKKGNLSNICTYMSGTSDFYMCGSCVRLYLI